MPIAQGKVQTLTLRQRIGAGIQRAILDGSLQPGERVVESALASQPGVSVTAVREAVIQLESEGLISKRSSTATNITALTHDEIAQTFSVRVPLERIAVADAARRKNPRLYVQRDFAWHEAVWRASGNEVLENTMRRLVLPLFGFSIIQIASEPSFDLIEDARTRKERECLAAG